MPKPRPAVEPKEETVAWASSLQEQFGAARGSVTVTGDATAGRLPHPRPADAEAAADTAMMVAPPETAVSVEAPRGDPQCLPQLRELGVVFEQSAPIDGDCTIPDPLKVSGLGSGQKIEPEALLNCATTAALAQWMADVVTPAARRILGSAPTGVTQVSAFVCRTRYDDPHAKLSEHALANAIDIGAFTFKDRAPVAIGANDRGSKEARFETEVRAGACDYFTTVLGPGSNAAHATHFHLDLAQRRGGYRLCELGEPTIVRASEKTKRE